MNRIIKFRGKCLGSNDWVYGFYYEDSQGSWIINETGTYPVAPNTIGQFTGLSDIDDQEIYHGDLTSHSDYKKEEVILSYVIWNNKKACFELDRQYFSLKIHFMIDKIKVVGNLWNTPNIIISG